MREAFAGKLLELARADKRIHVLAGDIGHGVFDKFREELPEQWTNVGIAEQNMIGVAAGMAMAGMRPVVYTIASFATGRCYEQIKVDVCMHKLPVTIVGVGAGLAYGALGPTHHAIDDIALMRVLPGMAILSPHDDVMTREATSYAVTCNGPTYTRLSNKSKLDLGIPPNYGDEFAIITTGAIAEVAYAATKMLKVRGVNGVTLVAPLLKPGPLAYTGGTKVVVSLEEHSVIGGLGSAVAEAIAESNVRISFQRLGVSDMFTTTVGDRDYLLNMYGLTAEAVAQTVWYML